MDLHQRSTLCDIIHEGFSTVSRTWVEMNDGQTKLLVVKSSSMLRKFAKEPHDIVKELRLLSSAQHPNIVPIMGSYRDDVQKVLDIYMPYLPISLSDLLASPYFSPHHFPAQDSPNPLCEEFNILSKGIMIQVFSALAFLHHRDRQIAHRDMKPQNIMFTKEGCVKLIDFGVAYQHDGLDADKTHDLWPEHTERLYFEVSTGPYRAPELLFGARDYQPTALDLWSLGACLAEFFTPLRLCCDDMDDDMDDDDLQDEKDKNDLSAFLVPKRLRVGYPNSYWKRDTLFEGDRGEIGIAWSIFKIFGTPTKDSWPEYEKLPGAQSVVFNVVPNVPLAPLLPNLPPSSLVSQASPVLDILAKLLKYPPSSRLLAGDALRHPWLTTSAVLCLPPDYELDHSGFDDLIRYEYNGKMFGELLISKLTSA